MGGGATRPEDEEQDDHGGWEVEYLGQSRSSDGRVGSVRTPHPSARSYELLSSNHETAAVLVLYDEENEAIALYSGLSWVACRRITKPGESM